MIPKSPKASHNHTKEEHAYLARLIELGCVLCAFKGTPGTPAEVHHPRTGTGGGRRASHFEGIPICPQHHRLGNDALHVMGRKAFERHHGITELELLAMTKAML
jgi:RecA-dependent nuclease